MAQGGGAATRICVILLVFVLICSTWYVLCRIAFLTIYIYSHEQIIAVMPSSTSIRKKGRGAIYLKRLQNDRPNNVWLSWLKGCWRRSINEVISFNERFGKLHPSASYLSSTADIRKWRGLGKQDQLYILSQEQEWMSIQNIEAAVRMKSVQHQPPPELSQTQLFHSLYWMAIKGWTKIGSYVTINPANTRICIHMVPI
jgi:hypothetical protein